MLPETPNAEPEGKNHAAMFVLLLSRDLLRGGCDVRVTSQALGVHCA